MFLNLEVRFIETDMLKTLTEISKKMFGTQSYIIMKEKIFEMIIESAEIEGIKKN